jgi:hypothetical protein
MTYRDRPADGCVTEDHHLCPGQENAAELISERAGMVRYQVLVITRDGFSVASVPDLDCEAVGNSVDEAIAAVYGKALRRLHDREDGNGLRTRSLLVLADIDLPLLGCRDSAAIDG